MMEDNTEISLRKRLMMLNSNQEVPSKKPKQFTIDLVSDASNDFTDFQENLLLNDADKNFSLNGLQPGTNVVSGNDSSDSELPETTWSHNLDSSQHNVTTFTLKDLKAIKIDLTSDVPDDDSFTNLKDSPPKNVLRRIADEFRGTSPETETDPGLSRKIRLQPVLNVELASSSDSELPCGIFPETLSERLGLNCDRDLQDIPEELPLPRTKVAAPTDKQKGQPIPTTITEKKLQAKLKAEEKERQKQERQREREAKRQEKERAVQIRKAQQMSRKAFQPKECLKHMSVVVDSALLTISGLETAVVNVCENLGSTCLVQSQQIPFVMSWRRSVIECDMAVEVLTAPKDIDEGEIVVCLPLDHFVELVYAAKQKQRGELVEHFQTLQGYVENVRQTYLGCSVTLVVMGMENYFRKPKKSKTSKGNRTDTTISRLDVEEALVNVQLRNLCNCQLIDSIEEMADIVRTFTKSIAEKPMKKDRLQSEFSFHNEKSGSIASDTQSLWKAQLEQFKNISNDISSAIVSQYPSPKLLVEAYKKCSNQKECIRLLEDIMVRRKAGVLETSRRVGKEASRRIYLLMTTTDGDLILK